MASLTTSEITSKMKIPISSKKIKVQIASIAILNALFSYSTSSHACATVDYSVTGLTQTNEVWLRDYLELDSFIPKSQLDLDRLRQHLTTTDIFSQVSISQTLTANGHCSVLIDVKEKLTRIPVIRGAYGGGTPLFILGGYETNAFGQLMAIGGEVRRYGNMAPGAFFFFKSPRAWRGRGLWGGELWLDRRRRAFFDPEAKFFGYADSEAWTTKWQWLYPLNSASRGIWQAGFQLQAFRENPTTFHLETSYQGEVKTAPNDLMLNSSPGFGGLLAPVLAYDGLIVDGLNFDGVKSRASTGVARGANSSGSFSEVEIFTYLNLPAQINLAGRLYAATTTQNTAGGVYYLGGFDSVRGLPDGIHYGNKIAYGNVEARVIAAKMRYAHIQPAIFFDTGSAWMAGHSPYDGRETSVGGGVRIAVPQVYRLVLRVDYGLSLGHTKSKGLSIGLNQFFQPYKMVF